MRNVREEELLEWASMRADDAGRLSRDVIEFRSDMIEVLEACETYFDNKADADGDEPNREMILLSMVQMALNKVDPPCASTGGKSADSKALEAQNKVLRGLVASAKEIVSSWEYPAWHRRASEVLSEQ